MKKKIVFNLLLCAGILSSCNSDNLSEVDVLSQTEKVVFIDNPYAMNESDAVSDATLFLNHAKKVSLRSSNSSETANVSISSKNYDVKIPELSSEEGEVKQVVPVYTINYKNDSL